MALNLVTASIQFWNTLYTDKAADYFGKTGQASEPGPLLFTSPLG